jgi:hypothetical protein
MKGIAKSPFSLVINYRLLTIKMNFVSSEMQTKQEILQGGNLLGTRFRGERTAESNKNSQFKTAVRG